MSKKSFITWATGYILIHKTNVVLTFLIPPMALLRGDTVLLVLIKSLYEKLDSFLNVKTA